MIRLHPPQRTALANGFVIVCDEVEIDGPRVGPNGQRAAEERVAIEYSTAANWSSLPGVPTADAEQLAIALIQATPGETAGSGEYLALMLEQVTRRVTDPDGQIALGLALIRAAKERK